MKLYTSVGPNPRVVTLFMAEKGIEMPTETIDIMKAENRQEPYLSKNPVGGTPMLELDDGTCLAESVAICEYLEERHPSPALIGATAEERAQTRMWVRRLDIGYIQPSVIAFRGGPALALFKDRMAVVPEAVEGMTRVAAEGLRLIDTQLGKGEFICGARFSLADILLASFHDFAAAIGAPLNSEYANIAAWRARLAQRPAFAA